MIRNEEFDNDFDNVMDTVKIGLEIHCQLTNLKTKLFCDCRSNYRTIETNVNTCPICLGLPGSLPMINKKAIEYGSMLCVSFNCVIPEKISFYRKNYFYPDLPKNYQITQYNSYELSSIGYDGILVYGGEDSDAKMPKNGDNQTYFVNNQKYFKKQARIKRIQLEEDPGKIVYENNGSKLNNYSLIDYNRAGVALVEIVTEPDFNNPGDVRLFLNTITNIFEYLGISDPALEGAVRCDVNVSIRGGKKVEIKNISSFRDVEKSLFYEITRQKTLSMHEIKVKSETRHWDEKRRITVPARTKEEEEEYRYFPEPDIPRIVLGKDYSQRLKQRMPELPVERLNRYEKEGKLSKHMANILVGNKKVGDLYEQSIAIYNSPKEVSNWIVNELLSKIGESGNYRIDDGKLDKESKSTNDERNVVYVSPIQIADISELVEKNIINRNTARDIFNESLRTRQSPKELVQNTKIDKIEDPSTIRKYIEDILDKEKQLLEQSISNPKVNNFILGKIMKATKGAIEPKVTLRLIDEVLRTKIKENNTL